jgi:alkylated DNA repair dioxygenase AlkB
MSSLAHSANESFLRLDLEDADVSLLAAAFAGPDAWELFRALRQEIGWQQEEVVIYGQRRLVPRLVAWHGEPGARYTYSGTLHEPLPWTPTLEQVRHRVQALSGWNFNAVLLNLYRNGRDGMGWHADDEPELGPEPAIASVSLGAVRRFCLRHRQRKGLRADLPLPHGSLLLMSGATQRHWVHAVPKTAVQVGERINLTFRCVHIR